MNNLLSDDGHNRVHKLLIHSAAVQCSDDLASCFSTRMKIYTLNSSDFYFNSSILQFSSKTFMTFVF